MQEEDRKTIFSESVREILVVADNFNLSFTHENPLGKADSKKQSMVHYGEMLLETFRGEFVEKHDKPASTDVKSVISDFGGWLARGLIMGSGRIGMLNMLDSVLPTSGSSKYTISPNCSIAYAVRPTVNTLPYCFFAHSCDFKYLAAGSIII